MKAFKLDKLDYQILDLMEEDCSLPYSEIAKKIDANMWTVRDRIELLKRRGIIEKCKAILDYSKMGYGCEALLFVVVNPSKMNELISFLKEEKKVKEITIMTGNERIMINIIDQTCIEIRNFIQQELTKFNVEMKEFNIVLDKHTK
ncbi:MAG: Lrp/AsnC family transcriptional regulator [Thermoplasmata archaeon]